MGNHRHGHDHDHEHLLNSTVGRLATAIILNFFISIAEIIGGIISGSLSLISDALHNISDGVSIIISWIALKLKKRDNSNTHTFGLKRAEILAAVINSSVLIIISVYLFYEAYERFMNPVEIGTDVMIIVAGIGLVANIIGTWLLKRDSKNSMNIRSSYLHLLSDTIMSVAVIIGGFLIMLWNINWVDPLLTVVIGLYIIKESFTILGEAVHVLMEGAPVDLNLDDVKTEVENFDEVADMHHLHIWTVGENAIHLEAHVNIKDMKISDSDKLRSRLEKLLSEKFNIKHTTLQFECNQCPDSKLIEQHP